MGHVLVATLSNGLHRVLELIFSKLNCEVSRIILNSTDVIHGLPYAFFLEPLEGRALDINQVRYIEDVGEFGEGLAGTRRLSKAQAGHSSVAKGFMGGTKRKLKCYHVIRWHNKPSSGFFQLAFKLLSSFLVHTLFDGLRSVIHQLLGFLEAQTGSGANDLNDLDLLLANSF